MHRGVDMPRYAKIILWTCLGLLLALVLAVTVLATMDWNRARPWINQQATELAGRPVAIQGDLALDWVKSPSATPTGWRAKVPWPQITAHDLVVGNPAGLELDQGMARVSGLSVVINPMALVAHKGQIEIGREHV